MVKKIIKKKEGNLQKYLFVDTDILIQCCFLEIDGDNYEVLTSLHNLLDNSKLKLLLPEVIKLEFNRRFETKKNELINEIDKYTTDINNSKVLNDKPKSDLTKTLNSYLEKKKETSEKVRKEIEDIFKHKNTIQAGLEITTSVFIEAYKMSFNYKKPFRKETRSDKEKLDAIQKDCLIIESLKLFLDKKAKYIFYFCSRNKRDFTKDGKEIPLCIHEDIKEKFSNISYFEDLGTLLNKEFSLTISEKAIERLRDQVSLNYLESENGSEPQQPI